MKTKNKKPNGTDWMIDDSEKENGANVNRIKDKVEEDNNE